MNIVYFDLGPGKDYVYHGTTTFRGLHKPDDILGLSPKQKSSFMMESVAEIFPEYWVLKVKKFNDRTKDTLDEWIYFLKNGTVKKGSKAKGLAEASEKLEIMKLPEKERKAYKRYLISLMDDASYAFTVKMDQEEMMEKAVESANAQHVARLDRLGKSPEEISELLGLHLEEVLRFLGRGGR